MVEMEKDNTGEGRDTIREEERVTLKEEGKERKEEKKGDLCVGPVERSGTNRTVVGPEEKGSGQWTGRKEEERRINLPKQLRWK